MPKQRRPAFRAITLISTWEVIELILENQRISREEMTTLPCQATHEIKARSIWVCENLHAIYAPHVNQPVDFICQWLKTFIKSNRGHFEKRAEKYLRSKGKSLDVWMDALREGRKGDILTLYGLSMLLDVHTVVHLRGGKIWSTMETVPNQWRI